MIRLILPVTCLFVCSLVAADDTHNIAEPDQCNPWYPDHNFPKLITPQWVGEDGVEAVVVLAIDDMRETAKYEQYLRPILNRLKQIDGRAPVSIMTCSAKPDDPQLQSWLEEGLSIEVHTIDHPCPLLQGGDFDKAKSTYDRCVDLLHQIPGNKPVAFRTPCCDSLNTVSPRFYSEIFPGTTPEGHSLQIDSSVMNFFTSDDKSIPRELVLDENGNERFWKYKVRNLKRGDTVHDNFVNYIKNYPYPYVINNRCWQFPCVAPSDWSAQHKHGVNNPVTVNDWKAALDITVHKQGVFNLVFHPHGWITAEQVVELINHAVEKHGKKVKFLTFREAAERLRTVVAREGVSLEELRVVDVNNDGFVDIVDGGIGVQEFSSVQTKLLRPATMRLWTGSRWGMVQTFPVRLRNLKTHFPGYDLKSMAFFHHPADQSVTFLDQSPLSYEDDAGFARGQSDLTRQPTLWRYANGAWNSEPMGPEGEFDDLKIAWTNNSCVWRDFDGDGSTDVLLFHRELNAVNNIDLNGDPVAEVWAYSKQSATWKPQAWRVPIDSRFHELNALRFVDVDDNGTLDLFMADQNETTIWLFNPEGSGWDKRLQIPTQSAFPSFLRKKQFGWPFGILQENNGFFVHDDHLCWMNEDTAHLPDLIHRVSFDELLAAHRRNESRRTLPPVPIGAAVVDITPDFPVRLTGYGNRSSESEGVAVKIHARLTVIGGPDVATVLKAPLNREQSLILTSLARNASDVGPACRAGLPPQADREGAGVNSNHQSAIPDASEYGTPQVAKSSPAGWTYPVGSNQPLTILITVDNCGVPANVTEAVFEKVTAKHQIARECFAICSTHTHSGPWLRGFAPNVLVDLPDDHAAHLAQYESELIVQLADVVDKAIAARRPGHLSVGTGNVGFAMNRRTLTDGRWTGFGETPDGPADHQLPILAAHDTDGKLIAVLANYACHATTETGSFNQISGDWPGFAADMIEADNPDAVALIAIGCGADANPSPRGTHEQAQQHGRTFADEVQRLVGKAEGGKPKAENAAHSAVGSPLSALLSPIDPRVVCNMSRIDLPLGPLPSRTEWEQQAQQPNHAGKLAQKFLKMLDDGQPVPTTVPNYPVQTWCFGEDLAMVFLGGEVVVDYSIRMNDMFDSDRLWINAYSNDVPCYIASKRILREGGYEADSSMVYYGHATRLAPEAEDVICDAVQKLLPHQFYSDQLQTIFPGPKSPEDSLASISTKPNLRVELVAAEPLIHDPVAFDWDVQGRLWVVEMGDYPSGSPRRAVADEVGLKQDALPAPSSSKKGGGRVRVLEDSNGDGRYDKATTFLDGLNFPTGITMWRNGVIITAAPDVIYAEDSDGDLKADLQHVLLTGFQEGNQQHRVNGLRWGLDGWLYLANGDSGGEISTVGSLAGGRPSNVLAQSRVNISGRDLRFQPDLAIVDPVSGQTQFGRERDDFDNWFGNNNSNPIWHYQMEERYLRRNPHATVSTTKAQVAEVPGAAPVFPTSQTLARFNDFDKANRFTSACSTSIYRDVFLGHTFYGNALTCEPVHNLASRLLLEPEGNTFHGRRSEDEQDSEFFASSDNWTRPVMVRTGPDGSVYIADMYRQVIEHPQWIPAEYQRKMNLQAGNDRGRIYRIVPAGECCQPADQHDQSPAEPNTKTTETKTKPEPNLRMWFQKSWDHVPVEELIQRLASPNGWWRDTAQCILQHRESVPFQPIATLAQSHSSAAVRVQALHSAEYADVDDKSPIVRLYLEALLDPHPEVRRHAIRLLESEINNTTAPPPEMLRLVSDPSPIVRAQLAFSLGGTRHESAAKALATLLQQNSESPHITNAVLTSLSADNISSVLEHNLAADDPHDAVIGLLIGQAAAMNQPDALHQPVAAILKRLNAGADTSPAIWISAANAMRSIQKHKQVASLLLKDAHMEATIAMAKTSALAVAFNSSHPAELRASALQFLTMTGVPGDAGALRLAELLKSTSPLSVQQAAANAVVASSADATALVLERWSGITPSVRATILAQLLQSSSRTRLLLNAIEKKQITAGDIDASSRARLLSHRDAELQALARNLLGSAVNTARQVVVSQMQEKLADLASDPAAGRVVFEKRCATCHRLQNVGKAIGADLAALKDKSTFAMLTAILDPNKAVEAKFLSYTVVTTDGLTYSGMLLSETGNSVTLLGTDGKQNVISRTQLDELVCSQRSLMPEGLEKDLSPQDLADVIALVQSSGVPWKQFAGNSPRRIIPDADGTLTLPAAAAQIYGPSLVFEDKYGNIGWWQNTDDYAVWLIDVPSSGHWTVEVDYACDNSTAGNPLKLSTGTRLLTARVPGTGTWDDYKTWTVGKLDLGRGHQQLIITAPEKPPSALIDLRTVRLIPPE